MIKLENGFGYGVFLEETGENRYRIVYGSSRPNVKKGWDALDMSIITFIEIDGTPRITVGDNAVKIEEKEVEINENEYAVDNFVTFDKGGVPRDIIDEDNDYG